MTAPPTDSDSQRIDRTEHDHELLQLQDLSDQREPPSPGGSRLRRAAGGAGGSTRTVKASRTSGDGEGAPPRDAETELSFVDRALMFLFDVVHRAPWECGGQIRTVTTLFIKVRDEVGTRTPAQVWGPCGAGGMLQGHPPLGSMGHVGPSDVLAQSPPARTRAGSIPAFVVWANMSGPAGVLRTPCTWVLRHVAAAALRHNGRWQPHGHEPVPYGSVGSCGHLP